MSEEELCYVVVGCPIDKFYVENTERLKEIAIDRNRERRTLDDGSIAYIAPATQIAALQAIARRQVMSALPFVDLGGRQKKA